MKTKALIILNLLLAFIKVQAQDDLLDLFDDQSNQRTDFAFATL